MEAMSAVSSPQTKAPDPMRISRSKEKPLPRTGLAEDPAFPGLLDGGSEPLDRERILRPHVDVTAAGSHGERADGHSFDQAVGIAFQNAPVHERSRVALVGVAQDVLLLSRRLPDERPLEPGGETRAAATPQTRSLDFFDYRFGFRLPERFREGPVTAVSDGVIERERIDASAVAEHQADLFPEERDIFHPENRPFGPIFHRQKPTDGFAAYQVLPDDFPRIGGTDPFIERTVASDQGHRPSRTGTHAAGPDHPDPVRLPAGGDLPFQRLLQLEGSGGDASSAGTDQDHLVRIPSGSGRRGPVENIIDRKGLLFRLHASAASSPDAVSR